MKIGKIIFYVWFMLTLLNGTELQREGWNLVSVCQDMNRTNIDMSNLEEIQNQDGKSIYTGNFAEYSNLNTLIAGYGYWIKGAIGVNFEGGVSSNHLDKPLARTGWNLMASCEDMPSEELNITALNLKEIQNQDGKSIYSGNFASFSNLPTLLNGYGYWVNGDKDTLWTANRELSMPRLFSYQTINNRGEAVELIYNDYVIKLYSDYNETVSPQVNHLGVVVTLDGVSTGIFQIQNTYMGHNLMVGVYNSEGQLVAMSESIELVNNIVIEVFTNEDANITNPIKESDYFITTWKTDNEGASNNNQITIPTKTSGYNYFVDWGDGNSEANVTGEITHTYANVGTYTVKISGEFPQLDFYGEKDNKKLLSVEQWGTIEWQSMKNTFYNCSNFVLNASDVPNLSRVTVLTQMFSGATSFNQNINDWNVSTITSMHGLFSGASSFNQALNSWDVSNVTSMENMFTGASAFNQDIGDWNVSSVTNMHWMFNSAINFNQDIRKWDVSNVYDMESMFGLTKKFNQDIGDWNVSSVKNMTWMFRNTQSFNQDIGSWNISNANIASMFWQAHVFNQDISSWDISNVTDLNGIFKDVTLSTNNYDNILLAWSQLSLEHNLTFDGGNSQYSNASSSARETLINDFNWTITDGGLDPTASTQRPFITTWKTDNEGFTNDNQIKIGTSGSGYNYLVDWGDGNSDTNVTGEIIHTYSNVGTYTIKISGEFPHLYFKNKSKTKDNKKIISVEQWGDIKWNSMNSTFYDCSNLVVNALDAPILLEVRDMSYMFAGARRFNQNINHWDVSNIRNIANLFQEAELFNQPLDRWDVSNVGIMYGVFVGAKNFNQDISRWNTSNVINMGAMFDGAESFDKNISSWNTLSVTTMNQMFNGAKTFNQDIGDWNVSNVTSMRYMFSGATKFNQDIGVWDISSVKDMESMFRGTQIFGQMTTFNQDLSNWNVSNVNNMSHMFSNATSFSNQDLSSWNVANVISYDDFSLNWGAGNVEPRFGYEEEYRTFDGSNNNVVNPRMGASGEQLRRVGYVDYKDGISDMSGDDRPNPRFISNMVSAQIGSMLNAMKASDFLWVWGQFLDHDIGLTEGAEPTETHNIPVPIGDEKFDPNRTGTVEIGFNRSAYDESTGTSAQNPRQQINQISTWIDASNVYGSNVQRAEALRLLDGTGKLKTSTGNLLPFNTAGLHNAGGPSATLFLAGDIRANEQVSLTAMHTLFVREHNRLAELLAVKYPSLDGNEIYQKARKLIIAEMQMITYNEFLPLLLGEGALKAYTGYKANVDASIINLFSGAAYRFGHSALSKTILRHDALNNEIEEGHLSLQQAFFAPQRLIESGIAPILRGLAFQQCQSIDSIIIDDVRNFLFGQPGSGGFDLAVLNIQRGRDHGLPSYNNAREAIGLPRKVDIDAVTEGTSMRSRLHSAYDYVNDIDVWVGGLSEDHVEGAMVGEFIHTILTQQFEALRDGDRFWYEVALSADELSLIEGTRLSTVIRANTEIGNEIKDDVFRVD